MKWFERYSRIIFIVPVLCCFLAMPGYAADSWAKKYIGKGIKKLFPKIEEVAWIMDFWAIIEQVGALARETLTLVHQYQENYEQLVKVKESIENAWQNVQKLYENFDPYDMDNWASTLRGAQMVINYDCGGAIRAWAAEDFVGVTHDYLFNVDSIFNHDYRKRKNKEFVEEYYFNKDLENWRLEYARVFGNYATVTFTNMEEEIARLRRDGDTTGRIDSLELEMQTYYDRLVGVAINHEDTLINVIKNMVVYNLTGVQTIEGLIRDFESAADFFVEEFYMLKDGVGTSRVAERNARADTLKQQYNKQETSASTWDDRDMNSVPPPPKTSHEDGHNAYKSSHGFTLPWKREVSEHDIAHFQNAVDFTLIQQDMALRDLSVMNAQAIAVLMAAKAYDANRIVTARLMMIDQSIGGEQ